MIKKINADEMNNVNGGLTLRQYNCDLPDCAEGGVHYEIFLDGIEDFKNCIDAFADIPELSEEVSFLKVFVQRIKRGKELPKLNIGVSPQTWLACEQAFKNRGFIFQKIGLPTL